MFTFLFLLFLSSSTRVFTRRPLKGFSSLLPTQSDSNFVLCDTSFWSISLHISRQFIFIHLDLTSLILFFFPFYYSYLSIYQTSHPSVHPFPLPSFSPSFHYTSIYICNLLPSFLHTIVPSFLYHPNYEDWLLG